MKTNDPNTEKLVQNLFLFAKRNKLLTSDKQLYNTIHLFLFVKKRHLLNLISTTCRSFFLVSNADRDRD